MKHKGKARKAAFRIILFSLLAGIIIWVSGAFIVAAAAVIAAGGVAVTPFLIAIWALFAVFTLYFFRDPTPRVPEGTNIVLSPAHGKVDVIDTVNEPQYMGGECRRVSTFLSVFDVHVQNAPVNGTLAFYRYSTGQFLNALKTESSTHNENLLLGFETANPPGQKIGVRLIAGVLARRIVPYVQQGETLQRGERMSLIQFGSRVDVYLPMHAQIQVKVGDRVKGGETVLAQVE